MLHTYSIKIEAPRKKSPSTTHAWSSSATLGRRFWWGLEREDLWIWSPSRMQYGLVNYQHRYEVHMRYIIFWLYKECGTIILVILEAPTAPRSKASQTSPKLSRDGDLGDIHATWRSTRTLRNISGSWETQSFKKFSIKEYLNHTGVLRMV